MRLAVSNGGDLGRLIGLIDPAGNMAFVNACDGRDRLVINVQNRVRLKTGDITQPMQNTVWCPPEGDVWPNCSCL